MQICQCGVSVLKQAIYRSLANWYTYPTDSCYSPETPKEKWVQRGGSCVCFSVLMNNRQMKRTYSGSSCAIVLVLHNLWFVPKSKLRSSFGVFPCHHCQWLMAVALSMPAWASGLRCSEWGSAACPSLAWCPPPIRDSCSCSLCMLELEPSMSVWLNGSQGFQLKIFQPGQQYFYQRGSWKWMCAHLLPSDSMFLHAFCIKTSITWDANFMFTYTEIN